MPATSKSSFLLSFTIFIISFICASSLTIIGATTLGFSVELIHRDSPKSPFYDNSTTPSEKLHNALHHSVNRATHFFSKPKALSNSPEISLKYVSQEYIMAYSMGTPSFQTYGIADTGSDFIWLQCMPCFLCYNQTIPMFDLYASSSTYRNYLCRSKMCRDVKTSVYQTYCDVLKGCAFKMKYLSNQSSLGSVAHDTLTLLTSNGDRVSFPMTVFGCAHETIGPFVAESSGVVGLGRGHFSLIYQMGIYTELKFSYCLAPYFSSATSKMQFGQNAVVSGPGVVTTPLGSVKNKETHYYVTLEGISVEDTRIDFPEGSLVEDNTIIDSGTRLSFLPNDLYFKVESEVAKRIKARRIYDTSKVFNLCYASEDIESVKAPIITAHFKDADVKLNPINTFLVVTPHAVCFAFLATKDVGIIGNIAQTNFMIGFDLLYNVVHFKPMDCTLI